MRRSNHEVTLIGEPAIGISLGYDFCSEHEWGIAEIEKLMGVNRSGGHGIARRLMGLPSAAMHILEFNKTKTFPAETRIFFGASDFDVPFIKERKSRLCPAWNEKLAAAWNERSFMVRAFTEEDRQMLRDTHQAFTEGNIALGLGRSRVFGNAPLNLVIVSRVPEDIRDAIRKEDEDHEALFAASKATGIEALLQESGRTFFALKPAWIAGFKSLIGREGKPSDDSDHPVIYFLNPRDHKESNSGWFTVEELASWARGEGPVLK